MFSSSLFLSSLSLFPQIFFLSIFPLPFTGCTLHLPFGVESNGVECAVYSTTPLTLTARHISAFQDVLDFPILLIPISFVSNTLLVNFSSPILPSGVASNRVEFMVSFYMHFNIFLSSITFFYSTPLNLTARCTSSFQDILDLLIFLLHISFASIILFVNLSSSILRMCTLSIFQCRVNWS